MYKPISRELFKITGYVPRFISIPEDEWTSPETDVKEVEPTTSDQDIIIPYRQEEVTYKPKKATPKYSGKNYETFVKAYNRSGVDKTRFDFFAKLANKESGFNAQIQNLAGAPAYGYFQFMQDGQTWNNIQHYAGVDTTTFRNNPELQIKAANKLANEFLKGFSEKDKQKAKELGYTDSALVAGAWLAGVGGVRKFLHKGISVNDKHWSKSGAGTDVATRMREFNNMFKKGGVIKAEEGQAEIKPDNRSSARKTWEKIATAYNTSSFGNSAVAEVLADFVPGFGPFHHAAAGDKEMMQLTALFPLAAKTSIVWNEAKRGLKDAYKHYGDDVTKYTLGAIRRLRNPAKEITMAERLAVPKQIYPENVRVGKVNHGYAFWKDAKTGDTVLEIDEMLKNPYRAGVKAANKQILQELVGSKSNDAFIPLTTEQKNLLRNKYIKGATVKPDTKDVGSRTMSYKVESATQSSFEELTESEAKKLFDIGWADNFFAETTMSKSEYWNENKKEIINLFRMFPTLIGAIIANSKIHSQANDGDEIVMR